MQHGSKNRTTKSGSRIKAILPYCNLLIAAGLTLSLAGVTSRIVATERESILIEEELAGARRDLVRARQQSKQEIDVLEREKEELSFHTSERINAYRSTLDKIERRLDAIESTSRSKSEKTVETVSAFRGELQELRNIFTERSKPKKSTSQIFRDFEHTHRDGIVLIYTEFDYRRLHSSSKDKVKTVTGWGSGFFLTKDGYIATNKHVVQPWKFDPDIAAMAALGEIEVVPNSLRIACWTSGCRAFDDKGNPRHDVGFDNWKRKNLKVAAVAEDTMRSREMEFGSYGPTYKVHALDNNDLAILKAQGNSFHALPLNPQGSDAITKLDSVMALGFPRGRNGLEAGCVESSPSIGTVRKIENTVHITASIIPGNSGGPLIGPSGDVVGIVTRVYSETLGICLKLDHVTRLLQSARGKKAN